MITDEYADKIDAIVIDSKGASLVIEYIVIQVLERLAWGQSQSQITKKRIK